MAIFGFIVLCALALILTVVIVFAIKCGGEEFSNAGFVPSVIGLLFIAVIWYELFVHAPFKIVAQS